MVLRPLIKIKQQLQIFLEYYIGSRQFYRWVLSIIQETDHFNLKLSRKWKEKKRWEGKHSPITFKDLYNLDRETDKKNWRKENYPPISFMNIDTKKSQAVC